MLSIANNTKSYQIVNILVMSLLCTIFAYENDDITSEKYRAHDITWLKHL